MHRQRRRENSAATPSGQPCLARELAHTLYQPETSQMFYVTICHKGHLHPSTMCTLIFLRLPQWTWAQSHIYWTYFEMITLPMSCQEQFHTAGLTSALAQEEKPLLAVLPCPYIHLCLNQYNVINPTRERIQCLQFISNLQVTWPVKWNQSFVHALFGSKFFNPFCPLDYAEACLRPVSDDSGWYSTEDDTVLKECWSVSCGFVCHFHVSLCYIYGQPDVCTHKSWHDSVHTVKAWDDAIPHHILGHTSRT